MKLIVAVALAFVAVAVAAPPSSQQVPAQIIEATNNANTDGSYNYQFKSDDGIERGEEASVKTVPDEDNKPVNTLEVRGFYNYQREDGTVERVEYIANENGFVATGPSIPKVERR